MNTEVTEIEKIEMLLDSVKRVCVYSKLIHLANESGAFTNEVVKAMSDKSPLNSGDILDVINESHSTFTKNMIMANEMEKLIEAVK